MPEQIVSESALQAIAERDRLRAALQQIITGHHVGKNMAYAANVARVALGLKEER